MALGNVEFIWLLACGASFFERANYIAAAILTPALDEANILELLRYCVQVLPGDEVFITNSSSSFCFESERPD